MYKASAAEVLYRYCKNVAYDQAKTEERARGINIFVRDKIEDEIPEEKIIDKLKRNYNLSTEEAKRYIDQCMAEMK